MNLQLHEVDLQDEVVNPFPPAEEVFFYSTVEGGKPEYSLVEGPPSAMPYSPFRIHMTL